MSCGVVSFFVFFFNDTATTEIYTLSLHDALPIWGVGGWFGLIVGRCLGVLGGSMGTGASMDGYALSMGNLASV